MLGDSRQISESTRASLPWSDVRSTYRSDKARNSNHYRGWTFVDIGRWRYAAKDNTNVRVRACQVTTPRNVALAKFRDKVDEMERDSDD